MVESIINYQLAIKIFAVYHISNQAKLSQAKGYQYKHTPEHNGVCNDGAIFTIQLESKWSSGKQLCIENAKKSLNF